MKKIVCMLGIVICLTACGNNDVKENVVSANDINGEINLTNEMEVYNEQVEENENTKIAEDILIENGDKRVEDVVQKQVESPIIEDISKKPEEIIVPAKEKEEIEVVETPVVEEYKAGIEIGEKAIDFEVELLSGEKVKLSDYLGRPVFLNFWATWCGPCVGEMPDIEKIKNEYGDSLVVLAINGGELKEDVKAFIDRKGYTFNVGVDEKGTVLGLYDSMYIPLSVFIDEKGVIRERKVGALSEVKMREIVDTLVAN